MPTNWTNNDGLYVRFGTNEATVGNAGQYSTMGPLQCVEVKFNATSLGTGSTILSDTVTIPSGSRIEKVEVYAQTACTSGGSAALNVGLIDQDRSTTFDADGLVAALALTALDAAHELTTLIVGGSGAGALIGTTLSNTGLLVADYDTAAYTAGVIVVRVYYYNP